MGRNNPRADQARRRKQAKTRFTRLGRAAIRTPTVNAAPENVSAVRPILKASRTYAQRFDSVFALETTLGARGR
jgi:hypothetical protein